MKPVGLVYKAFNKGEGSTVDSARESYEIELQNLAAICPFFLLIQEQQSLCNESRNMMKSDASLLVRMYKCGIIQWYYITIKNNYTLYNYCIP